MYGSLKATLPSAQSASIHGGKAGIGIAHPGRFGTKVVFSGSGLPQVILPGAASAFLMNGRGGI